MALVHGYEPRCKDYPLTGFPVAVDAAGGMRELAVTSTLTIGQSGSGKGSVLLAVVRASLPHALGGYVEMWGADPKSAELAGPTASLFHRVAHTPGDILALVRDLNEAMVGRQGSRSFVATPATPLITLHFDEITSAFDAYDRKDADELSRLTRLLLLRGRSSGIVLFAYGQGSTKADTAMRDEFPQRVCLRMQTAQAVELVLGTGSVELGARAHEVPIASSSNGYASAGIGYLRADTGEITRVRFPYTSDDDLERLSATYGAAIQSRLRERGANR